MDDTGDTEYNNTHRAFLQAFLARSTLTYEQAKPILAAIFGAQEKRDYLVEDVTESDFIKYVTTINNAVSPYDLEIRSTFHQITRQRIYALVNSTSDAITQLATTHSADEISFLKRVLDAIFETNNTRRHEVMAISSMQAVKLAKAPSDRRTSQNGAETQGSSGQGLTLVQAEKMLKTVVEEGWFEKSRKGFYSLTPRALMELRGWLMETYNDEDEDEEDRMIRIKQCYACKEIITTGQRCPIRDCPCRLHDICTQRFFTTQKGKRCPVCKTEWTGRDFVGERAAVDMKEKAKRRSSNGTSRPAQSFVEAESDAAAGEAEVDDDDG
ncbi:uncharacterized protein KY384_005580 [Bacidia gigantensis]|uniref:uncharacterized protein n=1 Tax=Bacidia gigantensis TaxID=2732470 RepID=UPI001D057BAF|nr:uncharacterized protein KY384_005580 [Bacidia gigantensis]KAG8530098.1 hypothetical protein KY384_005580 [Bacidia gigantensis]